MLPSVNARRLIVICLTFAVATAVAVAFALRSGGGKKEPETVAATSTAVPSPSDAQSLSGFGSFPVFWVGETYHGTRLDRIFGPTPRGYEEPMVLTYGDCGDQFERACSPRLVIKTIPRCWPGIGIADGSIQIRGRAVSDSPNLTVEAGYGTVVIYADKSTALDVAQRMVVVNTATFPQYANIGANDSLPGTLCELGRLHPPVFPTPATPDRLTPDPHAATVIASFGGGGLFHDYQDAARTLGWTPLRNDDPRFTVAEEGAIGFSRAFKGYLPDFEQMYEMVGRSAPIMIRQEGESYPDFPRQHTSTERIGSWNVELYSDYGDVGAVFFSGASMRGQRIRVVAFAPIEDGFTIDDIREFVRTLTTG
jgi:hypothetical protein